MARERPLGLIGVTGDTLLTVLVRSGDPPENTVTRNYDAVQPPGLNRQTAFGSGIHQAGLFERDVAICDVASYASIQHAMSALERAVNQTRRLRYEGWELPIAAALGVLEPQLLRVGFWARLRLIPASPHWRHQPAVKSGIGSQSGSTVVTGSGFAPTDVGRLIVFDNDQEALIELVPNSTNVVTNVAQQVTERAYGVHNVVSGLL